MDIIDKTFKLYGDKTESDYFIFHEGIIKPTMTTIFTKKEKKEIIESEGFNIYPQTFIEKLSPDNINNEKFWKLATKNFPLFSIAGGVQTIKNVEEINITANKMALNLGVITPLSTLFAEMGEDVRMLEIGPGYGNILDVLKSNKWEKNYYAIDINPLFSFDRLFKCDGRNIPDSIPNPMDVVYSMNVFQHLSKNQRTSYYRQIFEVLKDGGKFIFGMFVETPENKNWNCWQIRDRQGRKYCMFFKQLTQIDRVEDLYKELKNIGYSEIKRINPHEDKTHYLTFEVTK